MSPDIMEHPGREVAPSLSPSGSPTTGLGKLNIPLNLDNWAHLEEAQRQHLQWFHQYVLDQGWNREQAGRAIDYDESTVFRVLKGHYDGNWKNVVHAIASFRKLVTSRGTIQQSVFVENPFTRAIFAALDYALANRSITMIEGPSGYGKTVSGLEWRRRNNHGRSVFMEVPPYGGARAFMCELANALGIGKSSVISVHGLIEAAHKAFNENRILIIDEASRLVNLRSGTINPTLVEIIRAIHDYRRPDGSPAGPAIAFLATARFQADLKKSDYMFEQLLGRAMPVKLPGKVEEKHVAPIVRQYIKKPSAAAMQLAVQLGNEIYGIRGLVEHLKVASRVASKRGETLDNQHFFAAKKTREKLASGELD